MRKTVEEHQKNIGECVAYLISDIATTYHEYTGFCEKMSVLIKPREHLFPDKKGGKQFVIVHLEDDLSGGTGQLYALVVICSDNGLGGARVINELEAKGRMVFAIHLYDETIRYYVTPAWLPSANTFSQAAGASLSIPLVKSLRKFKDELTERVRKYIDSKTKECENWLTANEKDLKEIVAEVLYRKI